MSRARWAALVLLLAITAGTRWLFIREQSELRTDVPEATAEYVLEQFELTVMNPIGQPRFVVEAPRLENSPDDGAAVVDEPVIQLFDAGTHSWDIVARSGWVAQKGDEVRLFGGVEMSNVAGEPVNLETEALTILPDENIAKSDEHVRISDGRGWIEGVGFEAELGTRSWRLLSNVRARLLPSSEPND